MNNYYPRHFNYFQQGLMMGQIPGAQPMAPGKGPNVTGTAEIAPKWLSPEEGFALGNLDANSYIPYLDYVPKSPVPQNEQEALMLRIQQFGFAAHELKLFLDTHPNDKEAVELFLKYREEEKRLTEEYEKQFRPIGLGSAPLDRLPWLWAATDWPWEKE
jgi:spore coat protein JB